MSHIVMNGTILAAIYQARALRQRQRESNTKQTVCRKLNSLLRGDKHINVRVVE